MLDGLITRSIFKDLAGTTAFRRGEEYFAANAVGRLRAIGDKITAKVEGTETYQVELRDDDDDLVYDCTCPRAADGYFCKHCVAVGLAWLAENLAIPKSGTAPGKKKRHDPWSDIKAYLATQQQDILIELLLDVAQRDDRLYQSLLLKAERTGGGDNVAEAFRRAIDSATRIHEYVDWHEVSTFASNIGQMVDSLAGDVGDLVAIKSRDLSSSYRYLDIAEIWTKAKQPDTALEWAERGLKTFPDRPDNRLRDFLVAAYLKRKRNDEALDLTWIQFEERPGLEHYRKLHDVARRLGIWPEQRNRALAKVADVIAREAMTTTQWRPKPSAPNYSLRVEIALWEKDLDAAWSAAHEGICDRNLLITLSGKLESSRPGDAISLYRRVVPPIVEQTSNAAYDEAIKLIRKVGGLMNTQSQSRQFGDYLAELRVRSNRSGTSSSCWME